MLKKKVGNKKYLSRFYFSKKNLFLLFVLKKEAGIMSSKKEKIPKSVSSDGKKHPLHKKKPVAKEEPAKKKRKPLQKKAKVVVKKKEQKRKEEKEEEDTEIDLTLPSDGSDEEEGPNEYDLTDGFVVPDDQCF